MVERAKRGVRSNRSLISHRFHAWCCQAAVLVAIAIPVFTTQLERSREATDLSNIRSAYAEAVSDYLSAGATASKTGTVTKVQQTVSGWQTSPQPVLYTRVNGSEKSVALPSNIKGKTVTVTVKADGTVGVATS